MMILQALPVTRQTPQLRLLMVCIILWWKIISNSSPIMSEIFIPVILRLFGSCVIAVKENVLWKKKFSSLEYLFVLGKESQFCLQLVLR